MIEDTRDRSLAVRLPQWSLWLALAVLAWFAIAAFGRPLGVLQHGLGPTIEIIMRLLQIGATRLGA